MRVIYLHNNQLRRIPPNTFRNMEELRDLRLSNNLLIDLDEAAFWNTANLHALYLSKNKLTQLHKQWFDTFHESWTNADREQHGQVFLGENPWVCDCTTLEVVDWIQDHPFFRDHYDAEARSYVQLGNCNYPPNLRGHHFMELEEHQLQCKRPEKFSGSEKSLTMDMGDMDFEISLTVTGRPLPVVDWFYKTVNGSDVEIQCTHERVETPEHNESNMDSFPVTHIIKPATCENLTEPGVYSFSARLSGKDDFNYDTDVWEEYTLTVKYERTTLKVFLVIFILILTFLICWRYRSSLADTFRSFRGAKTVGMPAYAYQNVSTGDQETLIHNEESERAYTPENEMKINV